MSLELNLPPNVLYNHHQKLRIDKVGVLIGENGSGKSLILQSIFEQKLKENEPKELRIVCASSGQNESFSKAYDQAIGDGSGTFDLDCFYYGRKWSKLAIFLAIALKPEGRVHEIFKSNENRKYVGYAENGQLNPKIRFSFKIEDEYFNKIREEKEKVKAKETQSGVEVVRSEFLSSNFVISLKNFINAAMDLEKEYDFEFNLDEQIVELSAEEVREFSNITDKEIEEYGRSQVGRESVNDSLASAILFFTEAANNDRFIELDSIELIFESDQLFGNKVEFDDFSDGEYQLLLPLGLMDNFDSDRTLFLFDESDSHLHYRSNLMIWPYFHSAKGYVLTTTHQAETICMKENQLKHMHLVVNGMIEEGTKAEKILERVSVLSGSQSFQFEVSAEFEYVTVVDDPNDWLIFTALAKKLGCDTECDEYKGIKVIKRESDYSDITKKFAEAKIKWVEDQSKCEAEPRIKLIFLICDRDEAPLKMAENGVEVVSRELKSELDSFKWVGKTDRSIDSKEESAKVFGNRNKNKKSKKQVVFKSFLLAWKRSEIENYLLSHTALKKYRKISKINNKHIASNDRLKPNNPGDNDSLRNLDVKHIIRPLISDENGLNREKLDAYVELVSKGEISQDIKNMYDFIMRMIREMEREKRNAK